VTVGLYLYSRDGGIIYSRYSGILYSRDGGIYIPVTTGFRKAPARQAAEGSGKGSPSGEVLRGESPRGEI